MRKKTEKRIGFTLVETLIAIAILLLAILGPLLISSGALHSAYYASDQVTAFYLAQEGIEYVRMLRDNELIAMGGSPNDSWDSGFSQCEGGGCGLNAISAFPGGNIFFNPGPNSLVLCNGIGDDACIVRKNTDGYFVQGTNDKPTNFRRIIKVVPVGDGYEDRIISEVTWQTGNLVSPSNFQIEETLFDQHVSTPS